jgi:formylglycine-generating enzyme required for sulfatase activity
MKKTALLFAVCCTVLSAAAQDHFSKFTYDVKLKKPPYSFLWVEEGKFAIKQGEVSVDEYFGFLEAITLDSTYSYVMRMKPSRHSPIYPFMDTTTVLVSMDVNDPDYRPISWIDEEKMVKAAQDRALLKKVEYNDYFKPYKMPMTGISYEQALEYAKWCTIKANMELYKKTRKKEEIKQVVIYRLPTPSEFEKMFKSGLENCTDKDPQKCTEQVAWLKLAKNARGCALANVAGKDTCKENKTVMEVYDGDHLHHIYTYFPNWIGVYHMMGNAAEMTSEKGKAMGGSYLTTAKQSLPGEVQTYTQPEAWLGIRLVAEVVPLDGEKYYFDDEGEFFINVK